MKVILIIFTVVFLLTTPTIAFGHPPSKVEAFYDFEQETLIVTVVHAVSDPSRHYISMIEIVHNGEDIAAINFSRQDNATVQRAEFQISDLEPGDEIEVVAYCNIQGSLSKTIELR